MRWIVVARILRDAAVGIDLGLTLNFMYATRRQVPGVVFHQGNQFLFRVIGGETGDALQLNLVKALRLLEILLLFARVPVPRFPGTAKVAVPDGEPLVLADRDSGISCRSFLLFVRCDVRSVRFPSGAGSTPDRDRHVIESLHPVLPGPILGAWFQLPQLCDRLPPGQRVPVIGHVGPARKTSREK